MQQARRIGRQVSLLAPALLAALFALGALPAGAAGLNDTGVVTCADDLTNSAACATVAVDGGTHPRQDARYGRDAAAATGVLSKVGGGSAGFDFTKIANDGSDLPDTAALGGNAGDWACTRDNVTGLIWEVKTASGLRDTVHTYSWLSSDGATNGGDGGSSNGGTCSGGSGCDTEKFVADVNAAILCNHSDWRLPTAVELESLTNFAPFPAVIDLTWFPGFSSANSYWSSDTAAWDSTAAWAFVNGYATPTVNTSKYSNHNHVVLVRVGP